MYGDLIIIYPKPYAIYSKGDCSFDGLGFSGVIFAVKFRIGGVGGSHILIAYTTGEAPCVFLYCRFRAWSLGVHGQGFRASPTDSSTIPGELHE